MASATFRLSETGCFVAIDLKNAGQSPATRTIITGHLASPDPAEEGNPMRFFGPAESSIGPVMSGSDEPGSMHFGPKVTPEHIFFSLYHRAYQVACICTVEWWDVFGNRQSLELRLVENEWDWEMDPVTRKRLRVGKMMVISHRHEAA